MVCMRPQFPPHKNYADKYEALIVKSERCGNIWHQRFAHVSENVIQRFILQIDGISKEDLKRRNYLFHSCMLEKYTLNPSKCKKKTTVKPVELVYTDVVGSTQVASIINSKYFITLFDEYSGYPVVRFINRKSQASDALKEMIIEIMNLFN